MAFRIIRDNITRVAADAVVNTANPQPVFGGGTDAAIYEAAGKEALLAERRKIGEIRPGEARATRAFRLRAKYIIHTVGPIWQGGGSGETAPGLHLRKLWKGIFYHEEQCEILLRRLQIRRPSKGSESPQFRRTREKSHVK